MQSHFIYKCDFYPYQDIYDIVTTERPVPPTITVVISSPVIQIIDVGETVQLPCKAFHNIRRVRKYFFFNIYSALRDLSEFSLHFFFIKRFQSQSYGVKPMDHFQINHIKKMVFLQSQIFNMQTVVFMFVKHKPMNVSNNELQLMLAVRIIDFK